MTNPKLKAPRTIADAYAADLSPDHERNKLRSLEFIALREYFQCTQKRMAEFLGVTQMTVGKWERQEARVPLMALKLLRLVKSNTINANKLADEIIKLKSAHGFAHTETEGEEKVLDNKIWEQDEFLKEIMDDPEDYEEEGYGNVTE